MVFGVILAGGIGSRMGNAEKPKQYIKIGDKPIIIHTIEKFYVHDAFEKLIRFVSEAVGRTYEKSCSPVYGGY